MEIMLLFVMNYEPDPQTKRGGGCCFLSILRRLRPEKVVLDFMGRMSGVLSLDTSKWRLTFHRDVYVYYTLKCS